MVRLNKQTDFQFPFLASNSSDSIQVSKAIHLDFTDRLLSIFATSFFIAILFAITLDQSNHNNYIDANSFAKLQPQVENIMPLVDLKSEEIHIEENEKPIISNKKILALAPSKKVIKSEPVNNPKEIIPSSNPIQPKSSSISTIEKKKKPIAFKNPSKENINFNQSKITEVVNQKRMEVTAKTNMVFPKPVFVANKLETQELVLNEQITQDLLPLSYFHAKEKAAEEGKLMYIKFGAKWCLPCQQMEKTTFKDEKVRDFSEKNYVMFSVDVDDFDGVNLKAYFNVKFLPTLLIFNSNGNFIAKYINYQSANSMLEILEKHQAEQKSEPVLTSIKEIPSLEINAPKVNKFASINFNQIILSKKRNGNSIKSLKSKAKNWRYTKLDFTTENIFEGELLLKVKETATGLNLTELNIPMMKNQGIADTTTTNFQLVLEHEKRKKKNGEYVVEIYHLTQNGSMLVGKTTLLKDGEIHF